MRILLTNDDGIYAEGLYAAYKQLIKFADVTVVAPDCEQSSVGHGITLFILCSSKKFLPGVILMGMLSAASRRIV